MKINLNQVTLPDNQTIEYSYDPLGRRISKTISPQKGSPRLTGGQAQITQYIYDMEDVVTETINTQATNYIHGPGIDNILGSFNSQESSYFLQDHLGSITGILDGQGNITNTIDYSPFGNITTSDNLKTSHLFTGRQFDPETGLYYYRNRYYSPDQGRFITQDPIELLGGLNLYAYVGNNPLNWVDPWGFAKLAVKARRSGNGGIFGHGWIEITHDNGKTEAFGNYPWIGVSQQDLGVTSDASFSWDISDNQAADVIWWVGEGGYDPAFYNCVDLVEAALNRLGIDHPDFSTLGISNPSQLADWLDSLAYQAGSGNFSPGVDEPSTYVLILLGISLLFILRRREFYTGKRRQAWLRKQPSY